MRALLIAAAIVSIAGTASIADAKPRRKLEVRLDPKTAAVGQLVQVYVLNAGTERWSHHSPGGSNGCERPLRAKVVRRARTETCTDALVGPKDTTLEPGQSTWVDTLYTDELAPGTYTITVEGVPVTARLRVVRAPT